MTLQGAVNKTFILLALLLIPAIYIWQMVLKGENTGLLTILMAGGGILGLIVAVVTIFKPSWSPVTAPIYAILEGLVIGALSGYLELRFPGIAIQAAALTFGVAISLLLVYTSRVIKVTQNFRMGIVAATGAVALVYLATFILGFFGIQIPYIHGNGIIGIGFSVVVVVIAALNLVLDFDFIESASASGQAPKYMEWYAAFGLLITLVWLYIEILRLLSKLRSR